MFALIRTDTSHHPRLWILGAGVIIAMSLFVQAVAGATRVSLTTGSGQWPKFHYDLGNSGFNPTESILSPSTVGGLELEWAFRLGGGVWKSPAIVAGVVFTASVGGIVYALDANTGSVVWTAPIGSHPSDITVSRGVVYVGSVDSQHLYALEAANGTLLWSVKLSGGLGTPSVVNDSVYVSTDYGRVYALTASDGAPLWTASFFGGTFNGLAVGGAYLYVPDAVGNCVRSYDRRTGVLRWTSCLGNGAQIFGTPTLVGGRVFVGARDGKLYALDAATGTILWTGAVGEDNEASAAAAYGLVYIGSYDGRIYAFPQDCTDPCSPAWTFQTGDQIIGASPAVANGVLYMGSTDGKIYALDALTGAELWSYATGNWVNDAPAVLDGVLYVGSFDRHLYAFGLPSRP